MAKKKKTSQKKKSSGFKAKASSKSRSKRSSSSAKFDVLKQYGGGFLYGLIRNKTSGFVNRNVAPMLPGGQYADELAHTGISFAMAKWGSKNVMGVNLQKLGRDGLIVEGALMGAQMGDKIPFNIPDFGNSVSEVKKTSVGYATY